MAVPWQVIKRVRSAVRRTLGSDAEIEKDLFVTRHRDTNEMVYNLKVGGRHYIFNMNGDLIKDEAD